MIDRRPSAGKQLFDAVLSNKRWALPLIIAPWIVLILWAIGTNLPPNRTIVIFGGKADSNFDILGRKLFDDLQSRRGIFSRTQYEYQETQGGYENVTKVAQHPNAISFAPDGLRPSDTEIETGNVYAMMPIQAGFLHVLIRDDFVVEPDASPQNEAGVITFSAVAREIKARASRGKLPKIYAGGRQSGTRHVAESLWFHYGLSDDTHFAVSASDAKLTEILGHLNSGDLHVAFFMSRFQSKPLMNLGEQTKIRFVEVDRASGIAESNSSLRVSRIPIGMYKGDMSSPPQEVTTVSNRQTLICSHQLSPSDVYKVMVAAEAVLQDENQDLLMREVNYAQPSRDFAYVLHEGAELYYGGERPSKIGAEFWGALFSVLFAQVVAAFWYWRNHFGTRQKTKGIIAAIDEAIEKLPKHMSTSISDDELTRARTDLNNSLVSIRVTALNAFKDGEIGHVDYNRIKEYYRGAIDDLPFLIITPEAKEDMADKFMLSADRV